MKLGRFFSAAVFLVGAVLTAAVPVQAANTADQASAVDDIDAASLAIIQEHRQQVLALEDRGGAYSAALTEPLLSLGVALQQVGLHAEAIQALKRGVHLSRVNDGLYSAMQLALLESEIKSHIALGQFAEADERHRYLYRVQQRTLEDEGRGFALLKQARWQRRAYELELDENGFNRLLQMWNLYRMALAEFASIEGEESSILLEPLYGMLRAQYLISGYQVDRTASPYSADGLSLQPGEAQSAAYRSQSFKQGSSVIRAIYDVEQAQPDAGKYEAASALVMLGDWQMWHGKTEDGMATYTSAWGELVDLDDAQELSARLFGTPVPLPSLEGIGPLPPQVAAEAANLQVEFEVDERGKVRDVQRLDDNEENEAIANRLMRKLRGTRFRPRFEEGVAVATPGMVWTYDTSGW